MDFELLAVSVSIGKFKFMAWCSLASFIVIYIGMRKGKKTSGVVTLFLSAIFPLVLLYMGYTTHLNNFYAIKLKSNNIVELLYVYPEGKSVILHNVNSFTKPQRGNSCILVVTSGEERFDSVMASNSDVCKKINLALKADT
jgi:hypothetical protein